MRTHPISWDTNGLIFVSVPTGSGEGLKALDEAKWYRNEYKGVHQTEPMALEFVTYQGRFSIYKEIADSRS